MGQNAKCLLYVRIIITVTNTCKANKLTTAILNTKLEASLVYIR